jgi:probable rRNA maturation factor
MAGPLKIEIANLQSAQKVNRALMRKVLLSAMKEAGVSGTLSVAVVDTVEITELNRRFLGRAEATDVLSFPIEDERSDSFGEVVVCADIAAARAARRNANFDAELTLYALHGLLHLTGYDDKTPAQRSRMRKKEREVLSRFGIRAD